MWSWSTNVRQTDGRTDRQTSCNRNTALCARLHSAVKKTSHEFAAKTLLVMLEFVRRYEDALFETKRLLFIQYLDQPVKLVFKLHFYVGPGKHSEDLAGTWWILRAGAATGLVVYSMHTCTAFLGTVENHWNTEIRESRDFAKMSCFCRVFCQNGAVLRLYKNILFLISIRWSLLCQFNTKIFTFPLPLLLKSVCFVTY